MTEIDTLNRRNLTSDDPTPTGGDTGRGMVGRRICRPVDTDERNREYAVQSIIHL
jgi:hypothetical protein